jgi:hypothetical protein
MLRLVKNLKNTLLPSDQAKLDRLDQQLRDAETARATAYDSLGVSILDELSDEETTAEYAAAVMRIEEIKAAKTALEKRMTEAASRRKAEDLQQKREAFRATLREVQSIALSFQPLFDTLRTQTMALDKAVEAAGAAGRTLGDEALTSRLIRGKQTFEFYLKSAASVMPGCAVGYVEALKPYSEQFPQPDEL